MTYAAVSVGGIHTCGVTAEGAAYCWGLSKFGQLGDGTKKDRSRPVPVAGGVSFAAVSAGGIHTCGLTAAGVAYCWGRNNAGQFGDGTYNDRSRPVLVAGGLSFAALSAGDFHTCGLTAAGTAYCWGLNDNGQLGEVITVNGALGTMGDRKSPVSVSGGVSIAAVSAGGSGAPDRGYTCGVTAGGAAYCWGDNSAGQLGDGTTCCDGKIPVPVVGDVSFAAVSAGGHTCAVTATGAAHCWGDNSSGQLGDGTRTSHTGPVPVAGGVSFAALSARGIGHTCGVTATGTAHCWGDNSSGQLGDGTRTSRLTPVLVVP
ncbi:MAG TPA: hypothetical protein VGA02_10370 [Gemmatimonadales bacterium]